MFQTYSNQLNLLRLRYNWISEAFFPNKTEGIFPYKSEATFSVQVQLHLSLQARVHFYPASPQHFSPKMSEGIFSAILTYPGLENTF